MHTVGCGQFQSDCEWILNMGVLFEIMAKITNENQICISINGEKNLYFCWNNFTFEQQYQNTGLKVQNGENLSLGLIFVDNFCQNT